MKARSRALSALHDSFDPLSRLVGTTLRAWFTETAADGVSLAGKSKHGVQVLVPPQEGLMGCSALVHVAAASRWSVTGTVLRVLTTPGGGGDDAAAATAEDAVVVHRSAARRAEEAAVMLHPAASAAADPAPPPSSVGPSWSDAPALGGYLPAVAACSVLFIALAWTSTRWRGRSSG